MALNLYSKLPENKQRAVKLRAEGVTIEAISTELDTPYRTVQDWFLVSLAAELAEYKAYIASQSIKNTEDLLDQAKRDAVRIWGRLVALAESDDPTVPAHVLVAAMDSVLDRAGIARVSKTEGKLGLSVSDADRKARFAELAELQMDIMPEKLLKLAAAK